MHPPTARRVARNSLLLWVLAHVLLFAIMRSPVFVPQASAAVLGLIAFLVWFDARRFGELLFHANLGTSPAMFVVISLAVTLPPEVAVHLLLDTPSADATDLRR